MSTAKQKLKKIFDLTKAVIDLEKENSELEGKYKKELAQSEKRERQEEISTAEQLIKDLNV